MAMAAYMKILQSTFHFYKQYTTRPDRVFMLLVAISLGIGFGLIALNHIDFHFTTILLFATHISTVSWTKGFFAFIFGLVFLLYGMFVRRESPRASTFIWGLGLFFWCLLSNMVLVNSIQATPFSPIDATLVKIDQWMGLNTPALMTWTHNHQTFHHVFHFCYSVIGLELIGIPLLLTIFCRRKALGIFYIAIMITLIIGCLIYYFFPTMAPSGIFHSPYFSASQEDTSMRFHEVHHYLKVTSTNGGLIAFPSFHVMWAILLTNACRGQKIIFYPLAFFNLIVIAATVFLGWHYLTDVIAAFILAIGGIVFAERVCQDLVAVQK